MVTGNYFGLLGVKPILGRSLGPEDDRVPNGHPVTMISYGYWMRRFASDPGIVGRKVRLCGAPFTIVGVTTPEFFGVEIGKAPDFFAPVMMQPTLMPDSENFLANPSLFAGWLRLLVRLRPGTTAAQVAPQLDAGSSETWISTVRKQLPANGSWCSLRPRMESRICGGSFRNR